jgi:hypothetical protein
MFLNTDIKYIYLTVAYIQTGSHSLMSPEIQIQFSHSTIWVLGFDSRRGLGIFLFTTASRTALGPTQPPLQCVPGALSLGVKQLGHEADHSLPSSAEVKNGWSYISTPQYVCMAWCLVKHRDFTLPLPLFVKGNSCYEILEGIGVGVLL